MKAHTASLLHELALNSLSDRSSNIALVSGQDHLDYGTLARKIEYYSDAFRNLGLKENDRVAVYLPKTLPCVISLLATSKSGGVIVPVNPVLKPQQVSHILRDSGSSFLVTSMSRLESLSSALTDLSNLKHVLLTDMPTEFEVQNTPYRISNWEALPSGISTTAPRRIETDLAAILYTSGSTGKPKGVVLSHRNLVIGAKSVAGYLKNDHEDRILGLLPLSFDAGFSQLTTALFSGARLVLMNYLLPGDVAKVCEKEKISGITGVPPLWMQIAETAWQDETKQRLRYFANTGGKMPPSLLSKLRHLFPRAKPFLMYGLTEAFRSTYLDPEEIDRRPDSIGKAIPNADILVINKQGNECKANEPGELVHRGPLVGLGYWNDKDKTGVRFKPAPGQPAEVTIPEIAVWSGDTVVQDEDGFLFFIGRSDDMIKTSGYRVSPTEVEDVTYASGLVTEAAVLGIPHPTLGQAILLVTNSSERHNIDTKIISWLKKYLPNYMIPLRIEHLSVLPKNTNGKIDRAQLKHDFFEVFKEGSSV